MVNHTFVSVQFSHFSKIFMNWLTAFGNLAPPLLLELFGTFSPATYGLLFDHSPFKLVGFSTRSRTFRPITPGCDNTINVHQLYTTSNTTNLFSGYVKSLRTGLQFHNVFSTWTRQDGRDGGKAPARWKRQNHNLNFSWKLIKNTQQYDKKFIQEVRACRYLYRHRQYRHIGTFFQYGISAIGKHFRCQYCRYLNIGIWSHIGKII